MSDKTKDILRGLLIGAVIACLVFALNLSRDFGLTRSLCDGFFVAAVMLLGIGGIKAIRNKGTFDVLGFGLKIAVETAIPMLRHGEKENMEQYRQRKASERTNAHGLLLAGAAYLILAFIALGLYHIAT